MKRIENEHVNEDEHDLERLRPYSSGSFEAMNQLIRLN
jgi:hypothetical protein